MLVRPEGDCGTALRIRIGMNHPEAVLDKQQGLHIATPFLAYMPMLLLHREDLHPDLCKPGSIAPQKIAQDFLALSRKSL